MSLKFECKHALFHFWNKKMKNKNRYCWVHDQAASFHHVLAEDNVANFLFVSQYEYPFYSSYVFSNEKEKKHQPLRTNIQHNRMGNRINQPIKSL